MSVTNCALSEMVEKEMNMVVWVILKLMKGEPDALDDFVKNDIQLNINGKLLKIK